MHTELQEKGVHVHISIDEKKFPKLGVATLYEEAKGVMIRIQDSQVEEKVETVLVNNMYL